MPLYEYECEGCGNRFERIQKFSDPPPAACASCGGPVRRLVSSPAFQFKGSGWYITDYARAGKTDAAAGEGKAADGKTDAQADGKAPGGKAAETKGSETKPADTKASDAKPAAAKSSGGKP